MSKAKLVSVRIDEDLLRDIDSLVSSSEWVSRSDAIVAGLKIFRELAKRKGVHYPARFYPQYGDVVDKCEFEYHREHK